MRQNWKGIISVLCTLLLVFTMLVPVVTADVYAADNDDYRLVVVSLGDSYSSGEGIEPFYGQGETRAKIYDLDWLAHRSELSWPGRLTFSGIKGHSLKEYKYDAVYSDTCQWYFRAASGAESKHIIKQEQSKYVRFPHPTLGYLSNDGSLPVQIDIFDTIDSSEVDYVTLTVGGNDVKFSKVVEKCVTGSSYLHFPGSGYPPYYNYGRNKSLGNLINDLWENIETTKKNISAVYTEVLRRAPYAEIIVAGYPELLNYEGKGTVISEEEALTVNRNVRWFNDNLERLVTGCNDPRIHFVSVEEAFTGHQAYSDDQWINEVKWGPGPEDLEVKPASAYSNDKGAAAYAGCVNRCIAEIEHEKAVREPSEGCVFFGHYYQSQVNSEELKAQLRNAGTDDNGLVTYNEMTFKPKNKEYYWNDPIEWNILGEVDGDYLLQSKKILEFRTFGDAFWHESPLRTWLNGEFYETAFSSEEQECIKTMSLSTWYHPYQDAYIDHNPGQDVVTDDKVWLLDMNDVQSSVYGFEESTAASSTRIAYASAYADSKEAAGTWWVRGSARWNYGNLQERYIKADGSLNSWYGTYSYGVRPVICVSKDAVEERETDTPAST